MTDQSVGTPMFDLDGRVLGISLQHFANGRPTGTVVLPAGDMAAMAGPAVAARHAPAK